MMKPPLAWLVAAAAYVLPPTWAYFAIARDAAAQKASHGWVCGNPAIGIVFLAGIAACGLSLAAMYLRGRSMEWWRGASLVVMVAEIAGLLGPFLVAAVCAINLFIS